MWEVEFTDEFEAWWETLSVEEQVSVEKAVEKLEVYGPALDRPIVDAVRGSRHRNMRELRAIGGFIRVLFVFDPRRAAILLIGGDKRDRWREFYEEKVPVADDLYDEHLAEIERDRER